MEKEKSIDVDSIQLQFDSMKTKEMKDMTTKEYYRKIRKILKVSLNTGNTIHTGY